MSTKELLKALEKYENSNQKWIKNNIFELVNARKVTKTNLAEHLEVSEYSAHNYMNQANSSQVPFKIALKICELFNVELDELIKENNREIKDPNNKNRKWTKEKKHEFIKDYDTLSTKDLAQKYDLKENSVITLYSRFTNEYIEKS